MEESIITNATAQYDKSGKEYHLNKFDPNHVLLSDINITTENVYVSTDTVHLDISQISLKEKSGIKIKSAKANLSISPGDIAVQNFHVKTPSSNIQGSTHITFEVADILPTLYLNVDLKKSQLGHTDLAVFSQKLDELNSQVQISGNIKGRLSNIAGENLTISAGNRTLFKGKAKVRGLPDINNTYIDFKVVSLLTDADDIKCIYPQANLGNKLYKLGRLHFSGQFTGFTKDFVAYGQLNTSLGSINSDVNVKYDGDIIQYSGAIATTRFKAGEFWNNNTLGLISINANVKGKGIDANTVNTKLEGQIKLIEYNDYDYKDIVSDR